ncbi:hypothetical protein HDU76_013295 [Blyttiomyces sp. JEL0837]|nr:hypothetical protein HDU76_013295 [Blyttiomyces sp. JEL0837]
MISNCPQGRHSMGMVRLFTSASVPKIMLKAKITETHIGIKGKKSLTQAVRQAARLPSTKPKHFDIEEDVVVASGFWGLLGFSGRRRVEPALATFDRHVGAEWVMHKSVQPKPIKESTVILYLHGGAHIFMSPRTHRGITTEISSSAQCPVLAVDYRLAPEAPFPSGIEDALAAYLSVIKPIYTNDSYSGSLVSTKPVTGIFSDLNMTKDSVNNLGLLPSQVIIAGDSSGGCLTLQLLLALRALGLPMPRAAVLLSPFVDHELKADSWRRNWNSDFLSLDPRGVEWAIRCYAGDDTVPNSHPILSPIHADLTGLPPLLIQAGDSEVLTDDSIRLHANAVAAGCKSELQLYRDMFHVFQAIPTAVACSEAFRRIGVFVRSSEVGHSYSIGGHVTSSSITYQNVATSEENFDGSLTPQQSSSTVDTDSDSDTGSTTTRESVAASQTTSNQTSTSTSASVSTSAKRLDMSKKMAAALLASTKSVSSSTSISSIDTLVSSPPAYNGEVAIMISWVKGVGFKEEEILTTSVAEWQYIEVKA